MSKNICQSCGMPLEDGVLGTEANGVKNNEYCHFCYKGGKFTADLSLEDYIERSLPFFVKETKLSEGEARKKLQEFYPSLKRWKK